MSDVHYIGNRHVPTYPGPPCDVEAHEREAFPPADKDPHGALLLACIGLTICCCSASFMLGILVARMHG